MKTGVSVYRGYLKASNRYKTLLTAPAYPSYLLRSQHPTLGVNNLSAPAVRTWQDLGQFRPLFSGTTGGL